MTAFDPIALALHVSTVLDGLGVAHTIGGSIAASFAGEPRATIDIDFVVALEPADVSSIVRNRQPNPPGHAIEGGLFVAGGTPLDAQQIARRHGVEVRPGQWLYVHPPEDILVQSYATIAVGALLARALREGDEPGS